VVLLGSNPDQLKISMLKAEEWFLRDPASSPEELRVLIYFSLNNVVCVFVDKGGTLLLMEIGLQTFPYISADGKLSVIVRRSFVTGAFSVEINGVKRSLRKGGPASMPTWDCMPVFPSVRIGDKVLFDIMELTYRKSDFEAAALNRRGVLTPRLQEQAKAELKAVPQKAEASKQGQQAAAGIMGCGVVLVVLGLGSTILPAFGYQFTAMKNATERSIACMVIAGFALIVFGVGMLIFNARRK